MGEETKKNSFLHTRCKDDASSIFNLHDLYAFFMMHSKEIPTVCWGAMLLLNAENGRAVEEEEVSSRFPSNSCLQDVAPKIDALLLRD